MLCLELAPCRAFRNGKAFECGNFDIWALRALTLTGLMVELSPSLAALLMRFGRCLISYTPRDLSLRATDLIGCKRLRMAEGIPVLEKAPGRPQQQILPEGFETFFVAPRPACAQIELLQQKEDRGLAPAQIRMSSQPPILGAFE